MMTMKSSESKSATYTTVSATSTLTVLCFINCIDESIFYTSRCVIAVMLLSSSTPSISF